MILHLSDPHRHTFDVFHDDGSLAAHGSLVLNWMPEPGRESIPIPVSFRADYIIRREEPGKGDVPN